MNATQKNFQQTISHQNNTEIIEFIRKPDIIGSNSYIIKTPKLIIVIDPGGYPEQINVITERIKNFLEEKSRAVITILTHCHIDHCIQGFSNQEFRTLGGNVILIHSAGFDAYTNNDYRLTQAEMFSKKFSGFNPDFKLFFNYKDRKKGNFEIANPLFLNYEFKTLKTPDNTELKSQSIKIPETEFNLDIYHAPGHSPDSVIIKFQNLLFLGDILFAGNPLVAGIVGWNKKDYILSIKKILWAIKEFKINFFYNGHGPKLDSKTVETLLEKNLNNLTKKYSLKNGIALDKNRVETMFEYAFDSLSELCVIFTIITGRISYLSYQMERLEEFDAAKKLWDSEECEKIELLITDFNYFIDHYKKGKKFKIEVILKAADIIKKIDKLFKSSKYLEAAGKSFLHRAETLLLDFIKMVTNYELDFIYSPVDLNQFIKEKISKLKNENNKIEYSLNTFEAEDDYIDFLINQIGNINVFKNLDIECDYGNISGLIEINEQLFSDVLIGFLEDCVCFEAGKIYLKTYAKKKTELELKLKKAELFVEGKIQYYTRRFKLSNAEFQYCENKTRNETVINIIFKTPALNLI